MERLTVSACIGCGSLEVLNACATDCTQRRLDLVAATDLARLERFCDDAGARVGVLAEVVDAIAAAGEPDHRTFAVRARAALSTAGPAAPVPEPAEEHVTWWCPDCGGLEAPQPCLGVCIREPVAMVDAEGYRRVRHRALDVADTERRLRGVLVRLAWATPRPGQERRCWEAIRRDSLAACASSSSTPVRAR